MASLASTPTFASLKARGNEHVQQKAWAEAGVQYTLALEAAAAAAAAGDASTTDEDRAKVHSNRGFMRTKAGDRAGALADFDQCIALFATWNKGYWRKAKLLQEQGQYREAAEVAEAGVAAEVAGGAAAGSKMLVDVLRANVESLLEGFWNGTLAGGYDRAGEERGEVARSRVARSRARERAREKAREWARRCVVFCFVCVCVCVCAWGARVGVGVRMCG